MEFKKKIRGRSSRSRSYKVWVSGVIEAVTKGMYDEDTYTVHLTSTGETKPYVSAQELRFERLTKDEERERRAKEIKAENQELKKQLEAERRLHDAMRQESYVEEGRHRSRVRRGHVRSHSARNISPDMAPRRPAPQRPRANSVGAEERYKETAGREPYRRESSLPAHYTWPQFIADLTHAVYYNDRSYGPTAYPRSARNLPNDEADDVNIRAPDEIRENLQALEDEQKVDLVEEYEKPAYHDEPPNDSRGIVADLKTGGDGCADDLRAMARSVNGDERDDRRMYSRGVERNTGQSLINVYVGHGPTGRSVYTEG